MGGRIPLGIFVPVLRLAGDRALGNEFELNRSAFNRPEQRNQRSQIVRPHIEHRPAALFVIESGIRMPALMTVAHHEGRCPDRLADRALVDQLAAGLQSATQKRVRRRAYPEFRLAANSISPRPSSLSLIASGFST